MAMAHKSPTILTLQAIDRQRLVTEIAIFCYGFLKANSSGEGIDMISQQFACDLIDTRSDWKLPEVKVFFDTIRQRQDLEAFNIIGYRVTPLRLNQMVSAFEELRCDVRELKLKEIQTSPEPIDITQLAAPEVIKKSLEKVYELTKKEKSKPLVNHITRPIEVQDHEQNIAELNMETVNKKVQSWMQEFDRIYILNGRIKNDQRAVFIDGQTFTFDEFLQKKLSENES